MSRIPIRIRVTLAFAGAMAVLLLALGLFLQSQLRSRLDESIDNGLRSRGGEVVSLVEASEEGLEGGTRLIEADESFAQVLTPAGAVIDSTGQIEDDPLLDAGALASAAGGVTFFERDGVTGIEGTARLLAAPAEAGSTDVIVVVGTSLGDRDEALASLRALLLIGGPAALLIASLVGYFVVGRALAPVEAMRRRAEEISASELGERLPVPEADDELRRLGTTLNEMLGRLEQAIEHERQFVDDASHELRTPLALHKTELELALKYGKDEAELRAAIASATEEVDRLVQLAEDLLVVARSGDGGLALADELVQVDQLLATVAERFRGRALRNERELTLATPAGLAVRGDRLRLEQALTSMVDNALRHGEGEIRLRVDGGDGTVTIHVGDQGTGFPDGFLERAFERFSRADSARARGGTGLGLAIVETIVEAHGGRAGAGNDPAGGADVWIELPAA